MQNERTTPPRGLEGAPDLDELQRGQEQPVSVETMEGAAQTGYGDSREMPSPDPGERPGGIRADTQRREGG